MCNQCCFCKDTHTIEWTDCKMHNPTTGTQMTKDFDEFCKITKNPKPCEPASLSTHCSNLLPCCDHPTHSNYHVDNCCRSTKLSHPPSHSCSCLRSCDCHDDAECSHQSSCPCVDSNYAAHNHVCPSRKPYLDIMECDPVGLANKPSEV